MKINLILSTLAAVIASVGATHAQDVAKSAPSARTANQRKPTPTPRKVWTEDNIVGLRQPVDIYLVQKQAQAAAEALAKVRKVAAEPYASSVKIKEPRTLEEVARAITDSLEDIDDQKATLARLNKELDESPEDQKAEKTKKSSVAQPSWRNRKRS
jgi:hypothetical protein